MSTTWQPSWWTPSHMSAWDRIKEAMRRDWEQTKHDLHFSGGHELNQGIGDTLKQAVDRQPIPPDDGPNPPKVIGTWDEAEVPMGYGYTARQHYGAEHPTWNEGIELRLRSEWERGPTKTMYSWDRVKGWVQEGYEYDRKP